MSRKPILNRGRYEFERFIDSLIELGFSEMGEALDHECSRVEANMVGRGGPQARADGGGAYVARLKHVGHWLHQGTLAPGRRESMACWRLAEKLVARGELKPEALDAIKASS